MQCKVLIVHLRLGNFQWLSLSWI